MTLNLHSACRDQLRARLVPVLAQAEIILGTIIRWNANALPSSVDPALPTNRDVRSRIESYVSETPFSDFISDLLSRELQERFRFDFHGSVTPLGAIEGYEDLDQVAARLVDEFDALPNRYRVSVLLPEPFSDFFGSQSREFALSGSVAIRNAGTTLSQGLSGLRDAEIGSSTRRRLAELTTAWQGRVDCHLQVDIDGYFARNQPTEPHTKTIDTVRTFYGLGIALRMFDLSLIPSSRLGADSLFVHRQEDDEWPLLQISTLDSKHVDVLQRLKLHRDGESLPDQDAKYAWLERKNEDISAVMRAGARAEPLALGARWYFDSLSGNDELLQFVQAAVVVEILLGEKASSDKTGLGVLLANRCAYLIARSHAERDSLLKRFGQIYDVRSRIVHRGLGRLTRNEHVLLDELRAICQRIIRAEVGLLKRDLGQN